MKQITEFSFYVSAVGVVTAGGRLKSNQICWYSPKSQSHCLNGLYNLHSERHPLSSDPPFKWGTTCRVDGKTNDGRNLRKSHRGGSLVQDGQTYKSYVSHCCAASVLIELDLHLWTSTSPCLIAEQETAAFSCPETHLEAELQSEVVNLLFVKSQINQPSDIYISLHISGPHLCRQTHTDIHLNPITQSDHTHTHTHTHTHQAEAEPPNALTVRGLWSSSVGLLGVDGGGEPEAAREASREGGHSGGEEGKWRRPCGSSHTSHSRAETEVRNSTFLRHLL